MEGAVIENIAALVGRPQALDGFIVRPDGWLIDDPASLVQPGPLAKTLTVSTLGAVRDYLAANKDALDVSKVVVHVAGPSLVSVLGPLDARARVREGFVDAKCVDMTEGFLGRFMPIEDFLLGVQVRFADADDRKKVLGLLSTVKSEQVKTATDDGMVQVVQTRAGAVLVNDTPVPNPVQLVPFRTFRDIVQPSSLFALRLKAGDGLPQIGLFEADGGAWKLIATERVRDWLTAALPSMSVLA
jgi:hypothetical protein